MTVIVASVQPSPQKARARALSLALAAASKPAPLLDVPTELGLEILELGLTHTPFSTLAAVSRAFSTLIAAILYKHVVLDTPKKLSLFARTVRGKTPDFVQSQVKSLAVTIDQWSFNATSRMELEAVVAACNGVRILSLPRPGILSSALSRHTPSRILPSELTIQSFDFSPSPTDSYSLATSLTHLRVSEPGDVWYSPLSILAFFGARIDNVLSHLSLARRMEANIDNDEVFIEEVQTILESRPRLKMLVVRIFPAHFPLYCNPDVSVESSTIWKALSVLAEVDQRLVLIATGLQGAKASWAHVSGDDFWERSRKEWESCQEKA
ncbi:hypothetical protein C8F01DRAFT_257580 [Mycena amicta]|nr:hypothetical protein C8F01DRAFT_257580 [Mycena amicta]